MNNNVRFILIVFIHQHQRSQPFLSCCERLLRWFYSCKAFCNQLHHLLCQYFASFLPETTTNRDAKNKDDTNHDESSWTTGRFIFVTIRRFIFTISFTFIIRFRSKTRFSFWKKNKEFFLCLLKSIKLKSLLFLICFVRPFFMSCFP